MSFTSFSEIITLAKEMETKRIVIAKAEDNHVLDAVKLILDEGLNLAFTLVGDKAAMNTIAKDLALPLEDMKLIHAASDLEASRIAVKEVASGEGDFLMKGLVSTRILLKEVLKEEHGLRTGRIMSHLASFEMPHYDRILFMTDGGINPTPNLEEKQQIIDNAVRFISALGISDPKVAVLAAVETVNPKMEATLDGAVLSKMQDRGQIKGGIVEGPLALDNAVSKEAAAQKGISGPVAGKADILLVPDIESGNLLGKSITFLGGGTMAGVVVGAAVPVVLTSRADSKRSKMVSMALAALSAGTS